jgi:hypothetical protein
MLMVTNTFQMYIPMARAPSAPHSVNVPAHFGGPSNEQNYILQAFTIWKETMYCPNANGC